MYDKKRGDKDKIKNKWESLKDSEREAIMQYIPMYIKSQPEKKYRKDPTTFLNNKSWNDEIITDTVFSTKSIEDRIDDFKQEILEYQDKYDHATLKRFFNFWGELDKSKTKMRCEMQPTWETKRRLSEYESNKKF